MKHTAKALNKIVDIVLAYRPKARSEARPVNVFGKVMIIVRQECR